MSRSLNRVTLIGNVGQDPEIRTIAGGSRVANFSLATSRQWTGQDGNKQEKTEWHKIIAWDNARGAKLANIIEQYVKKGSKLYIEGQLETRKWQDKDGNDKYSTEVVLRNFNSVLTMLGGTAHKGHIAMAIPTTPRVR